MFIEAIPVEVTCTCDFDDKHGAFLSQAMRGHAERVGLPGQFLSSSPVAHGMTLSRVSDICIQLNGIISVEIKHKNLNDYDFAGLALEQIS